MTDCHQGAHLAVFSSSFIFVVGVLVVPPLAFSGSGGGPFVCPGVFLCFLNILD